MNTDIRTDLQGMVEVTTTDKDLGEAILELVRGHYQGPPKLGVARTDKALSDVDRLNQLLARAAAEQSEWSDKARAEICRLNQLLARGAAELDQAHAVNRKTAQALDICRADLRSVRVNGTRWYKEGKQAGLKQAADYSRHEGLDRLADDLNAQAEKL